MYVADINILAEPTKGQGKLLHCSTHLKVQVSGIYNVSALALNVAPYKRIMH